MAWERIGKQGIDPRRTSFVTDVFRLREIPKRKRALERQKETLRRLEKVVQVEWQAYYQDRKEIDDDEKAIGQRLIEAQALTRLEAHLHYYGEHAHLDNPAHRNDIIRRSWNNIGGDRLYEDSERPLRLSGPPTRRPMTSGLPTIQEMGLAFSGVTPAQIQTKRRRTRCKYCQIKGHFNKECELPHQVCHAALDVQKCLVPSSHHYYRPTGPCPFMGIHSAHFFKQVQRASMDREQEEEEDEGESSPLPRPPPSQS